MFSVCRNFEEASMPNDPCGPAPAAEEAVKPGARMVKCVKFGREMPGLDRPPWKGEIGKRVFENVSKEAWKMWLQEPQKNINEKPPQTLDPKPPKTHEKQKGHIF